MPGNFNQKVRFDSPLPPHPPTHTHTSYTTHLVYLLHFIITYPPSLYAPPLTCSSSHTPLYHISSPSLPIKPLQPPHISHPSLLHQSYFIPSPELATILHPSSPPLMRPLLLSPFTGREPEAHHLTRAAMCGEEQARGG